jgi:hypothetical protein
MAELFQTTSWTGYNQFGKGVKRRLRFSKSGDKAIEDRNATHYIDNKRLNELKVKNPARNILDSERSIRPVDSQICGEDVQGISAQELKYKFCNFANCLCKTFISL